MSVQMPAITPDEERLESEISSLCACLPLAVSVDEQHRLFEQVRILIAARTPAQVERIERARGLRA